MCAVGKALQESYTLGYAGLGTEITRVGHLDLLLPPHTAVVSMDSPQISWVISA